MRNKLHLGSQEGFTLVELLAVLGVIVVVGAVTLAIIISSLRAASKSSQINIVRQNGNFAILQISRTIQYAKSFAGVSTDNSTYTTDCTLPAPTPNPTPQPQKYSSIKVILFDDSEVTFSCVPSSSSTTISESVDGAAAVDLIDTSSISISDCYFTCSQRFLTDSPAVGINLVVSQIAPTDSSQTSASIDFNTSVTMRNSNK